MCTKIFFSIHSVKISNVFFFLSRGYNLFMAHFKDLVLKNRIQMGKNMRMNFFKQRITIVLLLVVGVYIYSSINEFYFFEKDYYEYLESLFDYFDIITAQEFKEFFTATYIHNHQEKSNTLDQIKICTIDKVKTAQPKHIFFLGLNETIFPALIKDTGLLLDEDIQLKEFA